MRVAAPLVPPQVAVERLADMPQLVADRGELLVLRLVKKPRQIEAQQIEHLAAVAVVNAIDRPAPPTADYLSAAAGEAQRRKRRLNAVAAATPDLAVAQ